MNYFYSVAGRSLRKLYEIGNTKSPFRKHCQPRRQNGVKVSRVPYEQSQFRSDIPAPVYKDPDYTNQGQG